jgi:hypothetical protein
VLKLYDTHSAVVVLVSKYVGRVIEIMEKRNFLIKGTLISLMTQITLKN